MQNRRRISLAATQNPRPTIPSPPGFNYARVDRLNPRFHILPASIPNILNNIAAVTIAAIPMASHFQCRRILVFSQRIRDSRCPASAHLRQMYSPYPFLWHSSRGVLPPHHAHSFKAFESFRFGHLA